MVSHENNPQDIGPPKDYYDATSPVPVDQEPDGRKYLREVLPGVWIDVYDVLAAFEVNDPALAHAAKKILALGKRGHKDEARDRLDIAESITRSNERFDLFNQKT